MVCSFMQDGPEKMYNEMTANLYILPNSSIANWPELIGGHPNIHCAAVDHCCSSLPDTFGPCVYEHCSVAIIFLRSGNLDSVPFLNDNHRHNLRMHAHCSNKHCATFVCMITDHRRLRAQHGMYVPPI